VEVGLVKEPNAGYVVITFTARHKLWAGLRKICMLQGIFCSWYGDCRGRMHLEVFSEIDRPEFV